MQLKRTIAQLVVAGAAMAACLAVATPAGAATSHCEGHTTEVKVEGEGTHTVVVDGVEITVTITDDTFEVEGGETIDWCVKAGTEVNSGQGSSGESASGKDISYLVIYGVDEPPSS